MRRWWATASALVLLAAVSGCGDDPSGSDGDGDGETTTLTVYAAASLRAAFEEIGQEFGADHNEVTVEFNFAGSSDLVSQIQGGAPADVFASADAANMDKLTADDLVSTPQNFAANTLEIAVPPGNPAGVESLQDLTTPGLALVICAPEVPCGAATQQVADNAGLTLNPVSEEQSVTDVLGKVIAGEADAGMVYVTDVMAAGDDVEGITIPESAHVVNIYPIATVADSAHGELAQEFMDFVLADPGQAILADFGFAKP